MNPASMVNPNAQMSQVQQQQVMLQQVQQQGVNVGVGIGMGPGGVGPGVMGPGGVGPMGVGVGVPGVGIGPGVMNPGMVVTGPQQVMNQGQQTQDQQQQQQQQQQQHQQQQQQQQQQEQKLDSISRVKNHYWQMKEALMETFGCAASNITVNANTDQGSRNAGEGHHAKFEESLEKFYTLCDQMELNLITAIDCQLQSKSSQMYTPSPISTPPVDVQKYSHYLSTVRNQVVYAKDIHSLLVDAATSMSSINPITSMDSSN